MWLGVFVALYGAFHLGTGLRVLHSATPAYPKPIAAVFVLVGTALSLLGLWIVDIAL